MAGKILDLRNSKQDSEWLEEALEALGWTGVELSRRLGVTEKAVSHWRRGRRPIPSYAWTYLHIIKKAREKAGAIRKVAGELEEF